MKTDYTFDHKVLEGASATRRYFAKFERIIQHMIQVSKVSQSEGSISETDANILETYLVSLSNTFTALSYKFLMANRVGDHSNRLLSIDKSDSGFPIFQELLQMAADALQAPTHLKSLPTQDRLKQQMITHILREKQHPTKLQYALSQRIYYEYLQRGELFLSQNDPQAIWIGSDQDDARRRFLVHWATYDSQTNLPAIYLMELEDSGRKALPRDERRWPRVQSHLMAQSISELTLLTIARGFDHDFDDLHPRRLRRFRIGPMYSHAFTEQHGPLRDILSEASGEPGLDWALSWRVETLKSQSTTQEKTGFFSSAERQIYDVDKDRLGMQGLTDYHQSLLLPHRAYQVMEEKNLPSLKTTRKYVLGKHGEVLSY
ncbi:hypothetical protein GCM10008927_05360 [Amylibacter ulvae]|uniref:Uncharacterized protein n=1 Tax=Paramylibacter ulvae TaxID=1651968 RepID=A0ABQ3CUL6_9RHOB|nr:hypothetical protein [Amylibacter ulvae]GHA43573.1 hypothetical protein GCM10008927_05360 [Amylibacter ulvae]